MLRDRTAQAILQTARVRWGKLSENPTISEHPYVERPRRTGHLADSTLALTRSGETNPFDQTNSHQNKKAPDGDHRVLPYVVLSYCKRSASGVPSSHTNAPSSPRVSRSTCEWVYLPISRIRGSCSSGTKVNATPSRLARPVRPMRCR